MAFYIVLWSVMILLGIQYYFIRRIPTRYLYILVVFFLSVLVGGRDRWIGADTSNYLDFYYSGVANEKLSGEYEPVFMFVRYICYHLGLSHFVFFFLLAFVSLYIWFVVAEKLKIKNYYLVFSIYFSMVFLSYQFNTVRTGVMASIVWLAFAYKLEGKNRQAIITMLVAVGFHVSALAFIPILYLIKKEFSKKIVIVTVFLGFLCVLLKFGERLIDMFPLLKSIDRVAGYVEVDEDNSYGLTLGTIVNLLLFLYMYFFHKEYKISQEYRIVLNTMLFAIMVVCVFNSFHSIVTRVGQVLNLSLMFVWPLLISEFKQAFIKTGAVAFLGIYLWLYFAKGLEAVEIYSGRLAYIPYVWNYPGLFR